MLKQRCLRREQKIPRSKGRQRFRAFVGAKTLARGGLPDLGQWQLLLQPTAAEINADQPGATVVRLTPLTGDPGLQALDYQPLPIEGLRRGLTIAFPQQDSPAGPQRLPLAL